MTARVGMIGVGTIGQDHIRRLTRTLSGAQVSAVADIDAERARAVAARLPGARMIHTGQELIGADDVDAVLVASWGETHAEYVLAAIEADKPVFCEKPLAPTITDCLRILEAERARGRRLVQVGFMRRYDEGYRAMKSTLAGGTLGAPLLIHCAHRNAATPPHFTSPMLITDAAIHEIDLTRWLLDEEIAAVRVFTPRRSSHSGDLDDPQVVILETVGGVLVDIEVFVNCSYGYDIRCELVAEGGTITLADASASIVSQHGMRSRRVPSDWRERFVRAYDAELQVWLESVAAGSACGPSVWDGYAATAVAEACLKALETAQRTPVELVGRPALYEPAG